MAEVHIVDIDGEQWDIKDLPLTTKVNLLGDTTKIKAIGESYITPKNNIFNILHLQILVKIKKPLYKRLLFHILLELLIYMNFRL